MEGPNDSDHSMSWEDFFGSTTDLTPTLIGIYDSLLEPKSQDNDKKRAPPNRVFCKEEENTDCTLNKLEVRSEPSKTASGSKVPALPVNRSFLHQVKASEPEKDLIVNSKRIHEDNESCNLGVSNEQNSNLCTKSTEADIVQHSGYDNSNIVAVTRTNNHKRELILDVKQPNKQDSSFEILSPTVKRMISSATENNANPLKMQKRMPARSSCRSHRSNIPLVGATSKISQSGVEILPSVEIYDQPCVINAKKPIQNQKSEHFLQPKIIQVDVQNFEETLGVRVEMRPNDIASIVPSEEDGTDKETLKPNFMLRSNYDVPSNQQSIYDVPASVKTGISTLSLPYIDQSIEYTADREFESKLPSTEASPEKPLSSTPETTPVKLSSPKNETPRKLPKSLVYSEVAASTGNLGSVPKVEVTRPLSLSSIASSSSSSSGAQNKGVNSAYLASVESLEDHSDVDGLADISGDRARLEQSLANGDQEQRGLSQLERVCAEIVQTENVYVEDLRQVIQGYLWVWRNERTFTEDELAELFNNIEDIYEFNKGLCEELNACGMDGGRLARVFCARTHGWRVYADYCTGYPVTMARLASLAAYAPAALSARERQAALGHPLPLASYLLKPVQRILKYHLLLQNLVKQLRSQDTESAVARMTAIAQDIDDMKRRHEHAIRVQEIQSLLYGWVGSDLTTYGELCAEGTFRVFGAKAMRHAFLFDKMLLITKDRGDGVLAYKSHILCNNLMLVESIPGAPLSFQVIPWDSPRSQLTLLASSQRHKREWTLLLKRVILENYNAVIPSHARRLVMELGQNKTDDDILAEKSHSLMTQASMRKQLSAPEYLEKRKIDRDRRKTVENNRYRTNKSSRQTKAIDVDDKCECALDLTEKVNESCDNCNLDLCSDCELELSKIKDDTELPNSKCSECDRKLQYINVGSADNIRKNCECEIQSSQESISKDLLGYRPTFNSSDNVSCKSKDDISESLKDTLSQKTCLKCAKIKENIVSDTRRSRCVESYKCKTDNLRSKSRDDPQRSKLSKIGNWRRKSEPGLQNQPKKSQEFEDFPGVSEPSIIECRNCRSNKVKHRLKPNYSLFTSDPEVDNKSNKSDDKSPNLDVKMYNSKHVPKKISKIKKNRLRSRLAADTTAKFYADLSTDVSTENILHISESTDSINTLDKQSKLSIQIDENLSKDADIDDETYKRLIEKTDSFKKNELEKTKYLNNQNVIKEHEESHNEDKPNDGEVIEKPLEEIISQLLMQNREFQKILKKQQLRNSAQRRHQRLLKSHSTPEHVIVNGKELKIKSGYVRQLSENLQCPDYNEANDQDQDHIYETLKVIKPTETCTNDTKMQPLQPKSESDYVYLTFDEIKELESKEVVYDIPSPSKNQNAAIDATGYCVPVENNKSEIENLYDSIENTTRTKENEYLPMDKKPTNTTEIWLTRQKEHFNIPRERKSGSLPRSFQIIPNPELVTLSNKSNINKTYLSKDGKVMSTDRPFTIASDHSDLCYEDVGSYINESEMLKFNKPTNCYEEISKSTLELEEEIDRCYKDTLKQNLQETNSEILNISQSNLDSNSENTETPVKDASVHPEHKIYKQTNSLSIKNVLSKFKKQSKSLESDKHTTTSQNTENSANIKPLHNSKCDLRSPPQEKRPGLNPRSYSKNLLQRFKSIISDEHDEKRDENTSKEAKTKTNSETLLNKNDIQVIVTSDNSSNANNGLSRSTNEESTLSESQKLTNCENKVWQSYDAHLNTSFTSVSICSSVSNASSSRTNISVNNNNKVQMYKQGSKLLGARIAQPDYEDPVSLKSSKVNVLINRNSMKPDSSGLNFKTCDSEVQIDNKAKTQQSNLTDSKHIDVKLSDSSFEISTDVGYYEKSFEKIEEFKDSEMLKDSVISLQSDMNVKHNLNNAILRTKTQTSSCNPTHTVESKHKTIPVKTINKVLTKEGPAKNPPPVPVKPKPNLNDKPLILPKKTLPKPVAKSIDLTDNSENLKKEPNDILEHKTASPKINDSPVMSTINQTPSNNNDLSNVAAKSSVHSHSSDKAETVDRSNNNNSKIATSIQIKRLSFENPPATGNSKRNVPNSEAPGFNRNLLNKSFHSPKPSIVYRQTLRSVSQDYSKIDSKIQSNSENTPKPTVTHSRLVKLSDTTKNIPSPQNAKTTQECTIKYAPKQKKTITDNSRLPQYASHSKSTETNKTTPVNSSAMKSTANNMESISHSPTVSNESDSTESKGKSVLERRNEIESITKNTKKLPRPISYKRSVSDVEKGSDRSTGRTKDGNESWVKQVVNKFQ